MTRWKSVVVALLSLPLTAGLTLAEPTATPLDLPAQPLASALDAYSRATGIAILVDAGLTAGRYSNAVSGSIEAGEALISLLRGTGLTVQSIGRTAMTLVPMRPAGAVERSPAHAGITGTTLQFSEYSGSLQTAMINALCRNSETRRFDYRSIVRLWIAGDGHVTRAELTVPSGRHATDQALVETLENLPISAIPSSLPLPVKLVIEPLHDSRKACSTLRSNDGRR